MLEDLKNYSNLGTKNFFLEIFSLFLKKDSWKDSDLKAHFYNRVIDNQYIFDGGVPLLLQLGVLIEDKKVISLNPEYSHLCGLHIEELPKTLLNILFKNKLFEQYFINIFSPGFISIDTHNGDILINNNAFELKFSNIKQLLINLGFIMKPTGFQLEKYILSKDYRDLVIKNGLPRRSKRIIDLEQLEEQLKTNELYGREAEEFVLLFEKNRIGDTKNPIQISEIDVCAGFDILSFHEKCNEIPNRFIEVKSYSGNPHFHWSRNEIEKAKETGDDYFIYLVNREEYHHVEYTPLIIKNPYANIFQSNDWMKNVDNYYISKI